MSQPLESQPTSPSTRRQFLGQSAAIAGAAAVSACSSMDPAVAAASSRRAARVASDEPIRMALIGAGGMGNGHLDGIFRARNDGRANVDVVAVAEVCKPRLDATVQKCTQRQRSDDGAGVEVASYRSYEELLERDDIHAVLVASPEHWHADHAIDAIHAGKDVYIEKPMTLHLVDALRLKEVVDAHDRILQVGTQYMAMPKYVEARQLIQTGAIGKPTLSQTSYCRNTPAGEWNYYAIDPVVEPGEQLDWEAWCGPLGVDEWDTKVYHRWRRYKKWSTGIIGDLLVHQMTPLIYALDLGMPVRVTAAGGHYVDFDMENHDQVFLTVEFEGDHTMIVAGSTVNDTGLETMIRGHEANILLGGNNCVVQPQPPFVDDIDPQTIQCRGGDWQDELRLDFFNSVRTREPNRSTVDLGLKHMVAVDLATRSMWQGGAYAYDPATREVSKL